MDPLKPSDMIVCVIGRYEILGLHNGYRRTTSPTIYWREEVGEICLHSTNNLITTAQLRLGTTVTEISSPAQASVRLISTVELASSSLRPSATEPNLHSATYLYNSLIIN